MVIALVVVSVNALVDTKSPTIISISPINNEQDIATHDSITVQFSEPMDASTINSDTFVVRQRTTPLTGSEMIAYRSRPLEGVVKYNGLTASFIPVRGLSHNPMQPSQQYGNVFTVTITSDVKDLEGNSLSQDYMWSFTTGGDSFNTGITTSQSGQNFVPTDGSDIAPTVPLTVQTSTTNTQTTTENNFPWSWVASGALLLLAISLIAIASVKLLTSKKSEKEIRADRPNPFGDVHPVINIEGIGPKYNKKLNAWGIKTTKQLWEADAAKVARRTGAPLSSVTSWQNMAELSSVHDIGPQYAELIERSGVHNIEELKSSNANNLLKLVRAKQDSLKVNIQGNSPGQAMVEHWIDEARNHKSSVSEWQTA
jgi:hypothetical protein